CRECRDSRRLLARDARAGPRRGGRAAAWWCLSELFFKQRTPHHGYQSLIPSRRHPMAQPALFKPIRVRNLDLTNRIVIAPMCQYSAENGLMNDWHLMHLGQLANSGAALVTIEATAVLPEARITWADVGLYNDETEAAMRR